VPASRDRDTRAMYVTPDVVITQEDQDRVGAGAGEKEAMFNVTR
jgi:hypothetical protein